LSKIFVIYVIDFDPIWIYTFLALQNDCHNLNFVKLAKKWPEMVVKWSNVKVVSFFPNRLYFASID